MSIALFALIGAFIDMPVKARIAYWILLGFYTLYKMDEEDWK